MSARIKPRPRTGLAVAEIDGESVIYDQANRRLHHLNRSATLLWSLFDGTATIREVAEDVSAAYGVPVDEVESQIRAALGQLRRAGLLD